MRVRFPRAKINLYLRVLGKRQDGFHELETLFQEIDHSDTLRWQPDDGPFQLEVKHAELGSLDDNLVVRAARLFSQTTGFALSGKVKLSKGIPAGAGLGGGSSDAAVMLQMLNTHFGHPFNSSDLEALGLELGSDVPFFLRGGTQLGRGRGEELSSFTLPEDLPRKGFLFLPDIHIGSGDVFRNLNGRFGGEQAAKIGENDLLVSAKEVSPEFAEIYDQLAQLFAGQMFFMTGSGSSMVLVSNKPELGNEVMVICDEHGVVVLPFRFVDR
jgi:4-diphosphocytidyl-2-C-methyl-D-erythritol kinase